MEEEHLERDQNECDALDTVGVSPGMSVEVVPVVVNIKTLKKRLMDCTQVRDRYGMAARPYGRPYALYMAARPYGVLTLPRRVIVSTVTVWPLMPAETAKLTRWGLALIQS